jgi:hypothetical protein
VSGRGPTAEAPYLFLKPSLCHTVAQGILHYGGHGKAVGIQSIVKRWPESERLQCYQTIRGVADLSRSIYRSSSGSAILKGLLLCGYRLSQSGNVITACEINQQLAEFGGLKGAFSFVEKSFSHVASLDYGQRNEQR